MSGDNTLSAPDLAQNWNIVTGMLSVAWPIPPLIYAKGQRGTSGWTMLTNGGGLGSFPGFNVNNSYISTCTNGVYTQC